jgi:hypothetical protein
MLGQQKDTYPENGNPAKMEKAIGRKIKEWVL